MQLGIYSFGDMGPDPVTGQQPDARQRLQELMEEIKLADELGLDVYAVGEHHRPDYAVSSPATVLAAAAMITKNIRLSSAVTVLSSDDPVRVFQQFSIVDNLSNGRAEIMAGRGSFIESFPLFGYDLDDYDRLFSEKLDLLLKLNQSEIISWQGHLRPSIESRGVYPRPFQAAIPVWIAVGGTPASVVRAAQYGLPLALAIIGGDPSHFVPLINLYRNTAQKAHPGKVLPALGVNAHVYIADESQQAADEFYPPYAYMMNQIGKERGWSPIQRAQYEWLRGPQGSLLVGSPQQVIDKIMKLKELFQPQRFLAQMSVGTMPHARIMRSIELFATKVAPVIRGRAKLSEK